MLKVTTDANGEEEVVLLFSDEDEETAERRRRLRALRERERAGDKAKE